MLAGTALHVANEFVFLPGPCMALLYYVVHTMYYALCSTIILPALQACYDLLEKKCSSVPTKTDVVDHAASFFSKKNALHLFFLH